MRYYPVMHSMMMKFVQSFTIIVFEIYREGFIFSVEMERNSSYSPGCMVGIRIIVKTDWPPKKVIIEA